MNSGRSKPSSMTRHTHFRRATSTPSELEESNVSSVSPLDGFVPEPQIPAEQGKWLRRDCTLRRISRRLPMAFATALVRVLVVGSGILVRHHAFGPCGWRPAMQEGT